MQLVRGVSLLRRLRDMRIQTQVGLLFRGVHPRLHFKLLPVRLGLLMATLTFCLRESIRSQDHLNKLGQL